MTVEPFKPEHFHQMTLQPAQAHCRAYVDAEYLRSLADSGPAYTLHLNGEVLACFGMCDCGPDRGVIWSFVAEFGRHHMVRLHRTASRFLSALGKRQLQALTDFPAGSRWLRKLGFKYERDMPEISPDGHLYQLYVRNLYEQIE